MTPEDKTVLLAAVFADDLSREQVERLRAACQEDEGLLMELTRLTVVDRILTHTHLYPAPQEFVREVDARLRTQSLEPSTLVRIVARCVRSKRSWRVPRWGFAAAAALIIAVGMWWNVSRRPVASVVRIEALTLPDGQRRLSMGEQLRPGRLRIAAGYLELQLDTGPRLVVEGPAELELQRGNGAYLYRGRVVARVPKAARGFILDSPRGRLVDLGTEFGVSVGDKAGMEVHVLQGLVEATPSNRTGSLRLSQNQAVRFGAGGVSRIPSNPLAFVTDLPRRSVRPLGSVHWSFDEGKGQATGNRGRGLGLPNADAVFRAFTPSSRGPQWTTGRFGAGVYLDGEGAFLESPFTGISGDQPRTVAFWVKVPRDLASWQGYGIINWGSLAEPGAAWQVSINPEPSEGPVGRLRVGVHSGPVVGVTDLRDGRWHHCAVVMYGGARPDVSTHVLLYLDGELESTATKAVREIRTDTTSGQAHGIWLGRNLSFKSPTEVQGRHRFFRGWLDEVFIVTEPLSQEQIRQLMRENRLSSDAS